MSLFGDLFGSGYQDAAQAQIQGLNTARTDQAPYYKQAIGNTTNYGAAALAPWSTIFGSATNGANAYGDATGANGQAGFDRATANFRADPGYQFALNQAEQSVDRGAAQRGLSTSGNALINETGTAIGMADQDYANYVNRLLPYLSQQNTSATGIAQANQWTGGNLATENLNQGNFVSNIDTGIGNAQAAADTASQNASNSFINGLVQAGGTILGAAAGRKA
jgi:hypothetical protein